MFIGTRLWVKVKLAQTKIFINWLAKEVQKLAFAVVIMEFMLAGSFVLAVKYNLVIPQIAPVEAKTVQHNEAQAIQKQEAKPSIDENEAIKELIWTRESTRGKHNYSKCEAQGKINGIGFGIPGNGKYICFENHAEEMQVLDDWIENHKVQGMSDQEMLCHYSGGNYSECKN